MAQRPNQSGLRLDNFMSEYVKSLLVRSHSVQAHQTILDLLIDVGYERISIEAIAACAGVGKTILSNLQQSFVQLISCISNNLGE